MTILLRTLTLKSKLKFGNNELKNLTVLEFFNTFREKSLITFYYKLSMISFSDDVLDMLCIKPENRIPKPGKLDAEQADKIIASTYHNYYTTKTEKEKSSRGKYIRENTLQHNIRRKMKTSNGKAIDMQKNRTQIDYK